MTAAQSHRRRMGARRCAVQALYQWQIAGHVPHSIYLEFVKERETNRVDLQYFERLVCEIPRHFDDLCRGLEPLLDRAWSAVGPVERAILLIGAYEIRHCPEVPRRVAINEAIELAKLFGPEEGFRYVNAVLDGFSQRERSAEPAAQAQSSGTPV